VSFALLLELSSYRAYGRSTEGVTSQYIFGACTIRITLYNTGIVRLLTINLKNMVAKANSAFMKPMKLTADLEAIVGSKGQENNFER
jgi:hypothetical protein